MTIVPMLRVGMQFVTLCVTRRFCDVRWIEVRLRSPFAPCLSFLTLRVGMQFVTLRVTRQFCDVRWIEVRLSSPFRPSATYFDGAKVGKTRSSVSGPTSSGSFAL
ncbi:hypothetical protein GE543_26800, partial [Pseudomonas sp. SZ57]|nr:hypothetical protein [Pseudomonas sp. SZ57]